MNLGEYYNPAKKGEAKGDRLTLKEARDSYDSEQQKVKDLKNGRPTGKDPVMEIKQEKEKLTATALELIGESTGKAYIFPTPHNDVERPVGDTALAVAVGRNLKFPLTDEKGQPLYTKDGKQATVNRIGIDQFTPHDLRRTAATFMSQLGEHDEIIDAILNHAKKGIIATYNQNRYDREKQQALESWERKLLAIITGKGKDNVVSIGTAKKHLQTA